MKQLLTDAFGLIRSYKHIYLITTLIFFIGIVIGMLGLMNGPFPLHILINDLFGQGSRDFWETLGNSVKVALLMLTFGIIVIIPLFMALFQGMILGMTIMLLPKWTDGWTAVIYILLTGILFYPAIIIAGGNGALIGLKVVRQIKETTWSELIQGTVTLTIVLLLPVLLLSAGLKAGIASGVMDNYISGHSDTALTTDLDITMRSNGFYPAGKQDQPADFLFIRTTFEVHAEHPAVIPVAMSFTNMDGMTVKICYSGDTNLKTVLLSDKTLFRENRFMVFDNGNPPFIELFSGVSNPALMSIEAGLSNTGYRLWDFK